MASIFVSYNRHSEAVVSGLVQDVEALGHTVWFDQELTGGQTWWDQILTKIRACDLFIFVLDPASLESTACTREYGYAAQLGKTILPVLVADGVSVGLLPDELSRVQYVDVRSADRAATLRLARAVAGIPPAGPLPDPLPAPPEVPLSYLASLGRLVDGIAPLTYEQQSGLLIDLRKAFRDPSTRDDARVLMERMKKRRDLLAAIADEMREMSSAPEIAPAAFPGMPPADRPGAPRSAFVERIAVGVAVEERPVAPVGTQAAPTVTPRGSGRLRVRNAFVAMIVGTTLGAAAVNAAGAPWDFGFLTGAGMAIAAAIAGPRRRTILVASIFFVVILVGPFVIGHPPGDNSYDLFVGRAVLFAPIGCIVGAVGDVVVEKVRRRRAAAGSVSPT
jgi:hypothetical protein